MAGGSAISLGIGCHGNDLWMLPSALCSSHTSQGRIIQGSFMATVCSSALFPRAVLQSRFPPFPLLMQTVIYAGIYTRVSANGDANMNHKPHSPHKYPHILSSIAPLRPECPGFWVVANVQCVFFIFARHCKYLINMKCHPLCVWQVIPAEPQWIQKPRDRFWSVVMNIC